MTENLYRELCRISQAGRVLLATDFDGTLAPTVSDPACARLPKDTLDTLTRLTESGRVTVAVVSGRSLPDLAGRVEFPCIASGNHGLEIAGLGLHYINPASQERAPLMTEAVALLREAVATWRGAWVEDKGLTVTVHFRKVDRDRHSNVAFAVRRALIRFGTLLGLRAGKCSLEVHPRVGWNKGSAVEYIRRELALEHSPVICLGDDATDETMFRAMPGQTTIRVGRCDRTIATHRLDDTHAVGNLLSTLYDLIAGVPEVQLRTTA